MPRPQDLEALLGGLRLVCHSDVLPLKPSKVIDEFKSNRDGLSSFLSNYQLQREVTMAMYTGNEFFEQLNALLGNEREYRALSKKQQQLVRDYTTALSIIVFETREALPDVVYRGVRYPESLVAQHEQMAGKSKKVYMHNFASCSRTKSVAAGFTGERGWILRIKLTEGHRHCVADLQAAAARTHHDSELEVLISANAGFLVHSVNRTKRIIDMELVDEHYCMMDWMARHEGQVTLRQTLAATAREEKVSEESEVEESDDEDTDDTASTDSSEDEGGRTLITEASQAELKRGGKLGPTQVKKVWTKLEECRAVGYGPTRWNQLGVRKKAILELKKTFKLR